MNNLKNDFIDLFQKLDYYVQRSKILFKDGADITDCYIKLDYEDCVYAKLNSKVTLRFFDKDHEEEIAAFTIILDDLFLNDSEWEVFVADFFEKRRLAAIERNKRMLSRLEQDKIKLEFQIDIEVDKSNKLNKVLADNPDKERLSKELSNSVSIMPDGELKRKQIRLNGINAEIADLRKILNE